MSAFRNLNELTCHNKIKYNDDTNSRLKKLKNDNTYTDLYRSCNQ